MTIRFNVSRSCLLAFAPFITKDETRLELKGIHCEVRQDGIVLVASNGRALLAVRLRWTQEVETELGEFILPAELLERLPEPDVLRPDAPPMNAGDLTRGFTVETDGERVSITGKWTVAFPARRGVIFPHWRKLVPTESALHKEPVALSRFSSKNLGPFGEAAVRLDVSGNVEIHHAGEQGPALVFFPRVPDAFGLVVHTAKGCSNKPMRVPSWAHTGKMSEPSDLDQLVGPRRPQC